MLNEDIERQAVRRLVRQAQKEQQIPNNKKNNNKKDKGQER